MSDKKSLKERVLELVIFAAIIVISLIILDRATNIFGEKNQKDSARSTDTIPVQNIIPENIDPEQTASSTPELTDFQKYQSYKKISIYKKDGLETPIDYITNAENALKNAAVKIKITGELEDGYIFIEAGANDEKGKFTSLKQSFDGVWFYVRNGSFNGGQLDLSKSRYGQTGELTTLLYNLKNVPLAKNLDDKNNGNFNTLDLLPELKDSRYIAALVSTQRYGKIVNLSVGYKCASKIPECKIEIMK